MKTKAICSFFVLFAIVAGIGAITPAAFADHAEVTIEPVEGSGVPGCEETADGCWSPMTATVDVGGKVIFSNTDSAAHTYTAGTAADGPSGEFDTSMLLAGDSMEWSPDTAGEIDYFCMVHPWMQGLLIVQEAGAEEADDHGDEAMMVKELTEAYKMENEATTTGMLSDGTMVSIWATTPAANEQFEVAVEFADSEHVNYDIMVKQQGGEYMNEKGAHEHEGKGTHVASPLASSNAVDITVTFQGYGIDDPKTGPIGEEIVFSNVVPEFGTIAMMVLAVAIISIIAVTAKSRVIPRF
jgi:predicted secreted protein with PEFG-CTERM motif